VVGCWLLTSLHGLAANQLPLSIETLAQKADAVVHGLVIGKSCSRDSGGRLFTEVKLRVSETWLGDGPGKNLAIVHGGGVLGELKSHSSFQPQYRVGETVVAFVVFNSRGEAVTLGLNQGMFHVWKDKNSGLILVRNPFHGAAVKTNAAALKKYTADSSPLLTLARLKRRVKGALR